jgi:hypothetical protein
LKSVPFLIFNDFVNFFIGGHFENFKNKKHNFEWWSIFVSSIKRIRCTVWIKKKLHIGYHGNGSHFEFVQPPKAATHYGGYSYRVLWSLRKRIEKKNWIPPFCFHGNCGKVCPTDSDFFWLISFH